MADEDDFEVLDSDNYDYESDESIGEDSEALLSECDSFKSASKYVDTFSPYDYKVRHNVKRGDYRRQVRDCASHEDCGYWVSITQNYGRTFVHQHGYHSSTDIPDSPHGINKRIVDEVDGILLAGAGPTKCLKIMEGKYKDVPSVLDILPDASQLKNRKQVLKNTTAHPTSNTIAYLQQWATMRTCNSATVFFGSMAHFDPDSDLEIFQTQQKTFQDETLVLSCFPHEVATPGGLVLSFGVVVTSRRLLRNAVYASIGQESELVVAADGTYKIHNGGWTLASVGSFGAFRSRGGVARRYHPWAYMFVRAESAYAYERMFKSVRDSVHEYFGVVLASKFASLDHPDMILNAFRAVWPSILLLNCWPHLARNARKKCVELGYYNSMIKVNLQYLHLARSLEQFRALSELMTATWTEAFFHNGWRSNTCIQTGARGSLPAAVS